MMKKTYDWKITLKKVGISLLEVAIAGIGVVYMDNPYILLLVPIIEGVRNYWKNKDL